MDIGNRVRAWTGLRQNVGPLAAPMRLARCLAIAGMLAGCGTTSGQNAVSGQETAGSGVPDRLPVIVHLSVGDGPGTAQPADSETIAEATARVMDRLRAAMPAEEFAGVRTFSFFPAIALSADGDLLMLLLDAPEVASIERDRELGPLGGGSTDVQFE